MSRYFTNRHAALTPYVPGEQPQDKKYVKLNTNESPFPPSPGVIKAVHEESNRLNLYSDPESKGLRKEMAKLYGVKESEIIMSNGSDETLYFAFWAFSDEDKSLVFPDITYGCYPVFADLLHIPYETIALKDDFSINIDDYIGINKNIVIANPNAPTGIALSTENIEEILKSNPDNVVIIDEAYVDFGGTSCIKLINKYDNLLVIGTFSKSRSLAGARLGYGIANEALINDLNAIRYSTNPYNINKMTSAAGIAALKENEYYANNCRIIIENRIKTEIELKNLGFSVLPSKANFLFVKSDDINGAELYLRLKEKGVLVRYFSKDRIKEYCRISIGNAEQMSILISKIKEILKEKNNEKC